MNVMFLPAEEKNWTSVQELTTKVNYKTFFEDLLLNWLDPRRHLLIGPGDSVEKETILVTLLEQDSPIGFSVIPISEILKIYRTNPKLNETLHDFADQDGSTPDLAWFEERNNKLGIKWSEDFEEYVLPAKALGNMILSYALSSMGTVIFSKELIEDSEYRFQDIYRAKFTFFCNDQKSFWDEQQIILEKKLLQYRDRKHKV